MEDDDENAFKKNHFEPAWQTFSKDGQVAYDQTQKFLEALLQKAS